MHGEDKTFPLKPTIICEMHGDDKKFPLKPIKICAMHGEEKTFQHANQLKFVKCMETTKSFHSNQL